MSFSVVDPFRRNPFWGLCELDPCFFCTALCLLRVLLQMLTVTSSTCDLFAATFMVSSEQPSGLCFREAVNGNEMAERYSASTSPACGDDGPRRGFDLSCMSLLEADAAPMFQDMGLNTLLQHNRPPKHVSDTCALHMNNISVIKISLSFHRDHSWILNSLHMNPLLGGGEKKIQTKNGNRTHAEPLKREKKSLLLITV